MPLSADLVLLRSARAHDDALGTASLDDVRTLVEDVTSLEEDDAGRGAINGGSSDWSDAESDEDDGECGTSWSSEPDAEVRSLLYARSPLAADRVDVPCSFALVRAAAAASRRKSRPSCNGSLRRSIGLSQPPPLSSTMLPRSPRVCESSSTRSRRPSPRSTLSSRARPVAHLPLSAPFPPPPPPPPCGISYLPHPLPPRSRRGHSAPTSPTSACSARSTPPSWSGLGTRLGARGLGRRIRSSTRADTGGVGGAGGVGGGRSVIVRNTLSDYNVAC